MLKNKKGFIGAIGDDFPSLIPLFFAILLFFSCLGYAFVTINERNTYINTYIDSLKIAKTALGPGNYSDYQNFKDITNRIVTSSNYIVGLIYIEPDDDNPNINLDVITEDTFISQDIENIKLSDSKTLPVVPPAETDRYYYNASKHAQELINDEINLMEIGRGNKLFYYVYPVGLMTGKGVIPVYLVVFVW